MGECEPGATQQAKTCYEMSGLAGWRDLTDAVFVHFDFDAPDPRRFMGSIAKYALGGVDLFEIQGSAHSVRRRAEHLVYREAPRTLVTLQERGCCDVVQGDTTLALRPGDIFVLHSSRAFELRFDGDMKAWVVSIPAQLLGHAMLTSEWLAAAPIAGDTGMSAIAWDLTKSVAAHRSRLSDAEAARLGTLLLDVLNALASSKLELAGRHLLDTRTYQVERVRRYIRENLRQHELTASSVADALGISHRYMNKLFEAEGMTVGRLILSQRLDGARGDLIDPVKRTKPITEIAHDWGFSSSSHFSRVFRQQFGQSPRWQRAAGLPAQARH